MSSKRKNTPTKLSKDDVVLERQTLNSDCDNNHFDSEGDPEPHLPHQFIQFDHSDNDSSDTGSDRLPRKKQRLGDRVGSQHSAESDSDECHSSLQNNNNCLTTTKPSLGLHKKSMASVLRRLNSKSQDTDMKDILTKTTEEKDPGVIESVQQILTSDGPVQDKEQKLNEMIAQLQTIKDGLQKQVCLNHDIVRIAEVTDFSRDFLIWILSFLFGAVMSFPL